MHIKDVANNISLHMKQYKEEAQSIISPNLKRAAVLVPIFKLKEKLYVILTKRSDSLSSHKGDVCFPGGKQDADDADITATALREAFEEIGLQPSQVEVLGEMYPFISYNQLVVTPVIGFIRNHEDLMLIKNENEVDDIFACPLDFFLEKSNHHFISSKLHPYIKM
uniref:Nudix hydrolase domain-containing protein n=1 Tax=Ciona savignyi TaxID=51511 RepID=H2Y4S3_CIOSA